MGVVLKLLRGLAPVIATVGVVIMFFALIWREFAQLAGALVIIMIAIAWWRVIGIWIRQRDRVLASKSL